MVTALEMMMENLKDSAESANWIESGIEPDMVNHPPHYKTGSIEVIDYIEDQKFSYNLGNVVKYVSRADHKGSPMKDLEKARWYLNREIERRSNETK